MKIKTRLKKAEQDIQKHWRYDIFNNLALIQVSIWIRGGYGNNSVTLEDIFAMRYSLNPPVIIGSIRLNDFIDWFLDLEENRFLEENEDGSLSNFLDASYMLRAWNYYEEKGQYE